MPKMLKTATKKPAQVTKAKLPADLLVKVRVNLVNEKLRLEQDLGKFAKKNRRTTEENFDSTFPNYGDKEDENAAEVAEYAANVSIEQDLDKLLRDVNSAIERVDKGTYGICKYCKKPIEPKRLLARPTSSACVECKKTIIQEV